MNKKFENITFNWKEQFPDVPKKVHQTIMDTLEQLDEAQTPLAGRQRKKVFWKRGMVLAAALVAILGTTAIATEYFKWNERVVRHFHNPSQEMQNKLTDLGLTSEGGDSVTVEGITVSVVQTVQDEKTLYVLLKVTAEEPIIGGWGFLKDEFLTDEGKRLILVPGGEYRAFNNGADYGTLTKEGYATLTIWSDDVGKLDYDYLTLSLTDYTYNSEYPLHGEGVIRGCWRLQIPLDAAAAKKLTKVYEVNQEIPIDAKPVTVEKITLTPFSVNMIFEESKDPEKIKEYREKYVRWSENEGGCIYGIKYADGTVLKFFDEDISRPRCKYGYTSSGTMFARFDTPVDVENAVAILLEKDGEICIELK